MPTAYDVRGLNELAMRAQLLAFLPANTLTSITVSGDLTKQTHPCGRCLCSDPTSELDPSAGIFRARLDVEIELKADAQGSAATTTLLQQVRQCFYRNDLDPRAMVSLAKQLTQNMVSAGNGYTCLGIVPVGEGPVDRDQADREYRYRFSFDVHSMPRNP